MLRIIAGSARGRRIEAPEGRDTRPTLDRVRENLFNMLQGSVADARVLDLFAGSGALSLEALSRGAESAVMADRDREACRVIRKNTEALRFSDRARILQSEWKQTVQALRGEQFDLIFLDPPYAMTDLRDVMEALRPLMAEDCVTVIEHRADTGVMVPAWLETVKERKWGYCGVMICREEEKDEQLCDSGIV